MFIRICTLQPNPSISQDPAVAECNNCVTLNCCAAVEGAAAPALLMVLVLCGDEVVGLLRCLVVVATMAVVVGNSDRASMTTSQPQSWDGDADDECTGGEAVAIIPLLFTLLTRGGGALDMRRLRVRARWGTLERYIGLSFAHNLCVHSVRGGQI
jgi:hypothetical protein